MKHVSIHIVTGLQDVNQVDISPPWKVGPKQGSTVLIYNLLSPDPLFESPRDNLRRAEKGLVGSMLVLTHHEEVTEDGLLVAHVQTRGLPIEWFLPVGMCFELPKPDLEVC